MSVRPTKDAMFIGWKFRLERINKTISSEFQV